MTTIEATEIKALSGAIWLVLGADSIRGFDFSDALVIVNGASVSSATVTIVTAGYFTAGSVSVSSNIASVKLTTVAAGTSLIYCTATMDDASSSEEIIIAEVTVIDPADPSTWGSSELS